MYIYKKKWYTFGIIESIYYSKDIGYIVDFRDKSSKLLHNCKIQDFIYNSDKVAYLKALSKISIQEEQYVIYGNL